MKLVASRFNMQGLSDRVVILETELNVSGFNMCDVLFDFVTTGLES